MTTLKNIADEFNITILLVHHTRKEESSDAFNMISGTTGLLGCADGALVLQKPSRLSPEATLDVTGREMADLQLKLRFNDQTKHWDFIEYGRDEPSQRDKVLEAVRMFISDCHEWHGTANDTYRTPYGLFNGKFVPANRYVEPGEYIHIAFRDFDTALQ